MENWLPRNNKIKDFHATYNYKRHKLICIKMRNSSFGTDKPWAIGYLGRVPVKLEVFYIFRVFLLNNSIALNLFTLSNNIHLTHKNICITLSKILMYAILRWGVFTYWRQGIECTSFNADMKVSFNYLAVFPFLQWIFWSMGVVFTTPQISWGTWLLEV